MLNRLSLSVSVSVNELLDREEQLKHVTLDYCLGDAYIMINICSVRWSVCECVILSRSSRFILNIEFLEICAGGDWPSNASRRSKRVIFRAEYSASIDMESRACSKNNIVSNYANCTIASHLELQRYVLSLFLFLSLGMEMSVHVRELANVATVTRRARRVCSLSSVKINQMMKLMSDRFSSTDVCVRSVLLHKEKERDVDGRWNKHTRACVRFRLSVKDLCNQQHVRSISLQRTTSERWMGAEQPRSISVKMLGETVLMVKYVQ